jgi:hypothetical protein
MSTLSVKTIVSNCLGKTGPLSIKRDVLGVFGGDNAQTRSLEERLRLIQTTPFVRLAVVTIRPAGSDQGQYENLQFNLDNANEIWQRSCGAWIYCVGSAVDATGILGNLVVLNQNACPLGVQANPTAEENALFALGRDLGADVVGYFIAGSTDPTLSGCAAFPQGRRGFWVGFNMTGDTFAHELTHVIGGNPHPEFDPDVPDNDQDNLMWPNLGQITNLPPDLRPVQCSRVRGDESVETC